MKRGMRRLEDMESTPRRQQTMTRRTIFEAYRHALAFTCMHLLHLYALTFTYTHYLHLYALAVTCTLLEGSKGFMGDACFGPNLVRESREA